MSARLIEKLTTVEPKFQTHLQRLHGLISQLIHCDVLVNALIEAHIKHNKLGNKLWSIVVYYQFCMAIHSLLVQ